MSATVGIDLGGSNSFAVLYDESLERRAELKIDTKAREGAASVVQRVAAQVKELERMVPELEVGAIGLGVPGVVTGELVRMAPNLGWRNFRPLDILREMTAAPCVLVNDVNAGLMGELSRFKPAPHSVVAFFCGTGVGGAIYAGGQLLEGWQGGAGEVGHLTIVPRGKRCACGRRGCLEAYIGKWALNRRIRKRLRSGKKTVLRKVIDYNLVKNPVKSASLHRGLAARDRFTRALMLNYCDHLAHAIGLSVSLLNPEVVLLGGGIMEAMGTGLLPSVEKKLRKYTVNTRPLLELSRLGDYAGPLGAALYARQKLQPSSIRNS
ncbi:MAG: ROK family protein [Spirochaetales bacterium]|nr:ROK family protein [Spirochaetales bacterium]